MAGNALQTNAMLACYYTASVAPLSNAPLFSITKLAAQELNVRARVAQAGLHVGVKKPVPKAPAGENGHLMNILQNKNKMPDV